MSFETVVIFGKEDSECVKLGRDAMELGEGIEERVRVYVVLVQVVEEVAVDMEEDEDDLLKDMGI